MRPQSPLFSHLGTSIFEVMSRLAAEHQAVNLGQGFPDDRGPEDILRAAADALLTGGNQYPPMMGLPVLRQAVAAHEQRFYGLSYDPMTEVLVTSGATEALAACLLGLCGPGDEAILLEPCYDCYAPMIRAAGATPRYVTLRDPDWHLDEAELRAAFTTRTKLILLNNPHNPSGKVFTAAELSLIAGLCEEHDAYAICDEVYEHIVYRGARHIAFPTLPGMAARSLKIGSAGKTFSLTGWKVGMVVGPAEVLRPVAKAHQVLTFATPPNLQAAVAYGLGRELGYFESLAREMERRRDRLASGMAELGLTVLPAFGSYFVNLDLRSVPAARGFAGTDVAFCRQLVERVGVASIPLSAFYEKSPATHLVRLCFAKQDAVLDLALSRFAQHLAAE